MPQLAWNLFWRREQKRFGGLFSPPDVEFDSKRKGDFEGVGGKREEGGGCARDNDSCCKKASRQQWSITMQRRKVRVKDKNIPGQQQQWARCAHCLSNLIMADGFLIVLSCFSLLKKKKNTHFIKYMCSPHRFNKVESLPLTAHLEN